MKIIADENIANVDGFFSPHGELLTLPGRAITPQSLRHADALLIRSVTKVDEELLADSTVKFVASATSGIDHVDTEYLKKRGISFSFASGCNANSVVEYIFSALALLSQQGKINWSKCTYGIIGAGNIGGQLARRLAALDIPYRLYDPFLAEKTNAPEAFSSLAEVLEQDVISIHTPLTRDGRYPTYHLFDKTVIANIKPGQLLINAARGSVIDTTALLERLRISADFYCVLDAWECEPNINLELLTHVDLGTAHIAGYSKEGKLQGTELIYRAFCNFYALAQQKVIQSSYDDSTKLNVNIDTNVLNECILSAYNIKRDHIALLAIINSGSPGDSFDQLRKKYPPRHEFPYLKLQIQNDQNTVATSTILIKQLEALGFKMS